MKQAANKQLFKNVEHKSINVLYVLLFDEVNLLKNIVNYATS